MTHCCSASNDYAYIYKVTEQHMGLLLFQSLQRQIYTSRYGSLIGTTFQIETSIYQRPVAFFSQYDIVIAKDKCLFVWGCACMFTPVFNILTPRSKTSKKVTDVFLVQLDLSLIGFFLRDHSKIKIE